MSWTTKKALSDLSKAQAEYNSLWYMLFRRLRLDIFGCRSASLNLAEKYRRASQIVQHGRLFDFEKLALEKQLSETAKLLEETNPFKCL